MPFCGAPDESMNRIRCGLEEGRLMKKSFSTAGQALAVLAGILAWMASGAQAQKPEDPRILVVVGSAAIQGSNVTAARDAAIASSLMNAVALAAMEILSPEVFSENFKKLNEQLLNRTDAFIQDFRVLSEAVVSKQHRVVVQATVATWQISDHLAGVGLSGAKTAKASNPVALTVEGSGNLANFVKFRRALGSIPGAEGIQVSDMRPNETTLRVAFRGTAQDLAAALLQQSFDTFGLTVGEIGEGALRVTLAPK
jgi:hypothetical protein